MTGGIAQLFQLEAGKAAKAQRTDGLRVPGEVHKIGLVNMCLKTAKHDCQHSRKHDKNKKQKNNVWIWKVSDG